MPNESFIGLDFGLVNTGVAVGQSITSTSSALKTIISSGKFNWTELDSIIKQWQPTAIVVGNPLTEDGENQEFGNQVKNFAKKLKDRYNLPVHMVDERYTSMHAQQDFADARKSGNAKRKHAKNLDSHAAKIILQRWLDML